MLGFKTKKEKDFNREVNIAIQAEMERFATATAEHIKSFSELEKISKFKVNLNDQERNLNQQAGFSAEVKHKARVNADLAINGNGNRIERTDNVGLKNHPEFDHINVDKNGQPILDGKGNLVGSQYKIFSKIEDYDKLHHNRYYEKYKNGSIDIPSDQYKDVINRWNDLLQSLENQKEHCLKSGKIQEAESKQKEINKINDLKSRTRSSSVTKSDAMEARKNPFVSTIKDSLKIVHQSGIESAKIGASTSAAVSSVRNIGKLINGDKIIEDAALDVAVDSAKGALTSYCMQASSTMVGGALKSSNNQILKSLGKKGGPAAVVQTGIILAKNTMDLFSGKISSEEFIKKTGKDGFELASALTGSNIGAIAGTFIAPGVGTVIGSIIGGIVYSMASQSLFAQMNEMAEQTQLSKERLEAVKALTSKLIEEEKKYQRETLAQMALYLEAKESEICLGFEKTLLAMRNGENVSEGLSLISEALNLDVKFVNSTQMENIISKGKVIKF